jgi:hypothetical protein
VLVRCDSDLVSNCQTTAGISDHEAALFSISLKPSNKPVNVQRFTSRSFKGVDFDSLSNDLYSQVSFPILQLIDSQSDIHVDTLVNAFEKNITAVLDYHAPSVTKIRIMKARPPWFNEEVLLRRKDTRKIERRLRRAFSFQLSEK